MSAPKDKPGHRGRPMSAPDPAAVEALDERMSRVDWMDLWWQMTGDDWPVPEDFPAKFAKIVVNRVRADLLAAGGLHNE